MSTIITIILLFKRIYTLHRRRNRGGGAFLCKGIYMIGLAPHKTRFGILVKFWWNSIVSNASPPRNRILETGKKWRMKVLVTENSTARLCHTPPPFLTYTHPQVHEIGLEIGRFFFVFCFCFSGFFMKSRIFFGVKTSHFWFYFRRLCSCGTEVISIAFLNL